MENGRLIVESTFHSNLLEIKLWNMLFNNDLVSKWSLYYSVVNKNYENEQLINIMINYANKNKIGKNRSNVLKLNFNKIKSMGDLCKIISIP